MGEEASSTRLRRRQLTGGGAPSKAPGQNVPPSAPSSHVFVTGAGFTRAFVPDAPLLVDDFDNDGLVDGVRGLPNASRLLEWERNQHPDGFINISKSGLLTEPVLRLVWTLALETLTTAKKVTFIGYSFPSTDLAARTLFSEALRDLPARTYA